MCFLLIFDNFGWTLEEQIILITIKPSQACAFIGLLKKNENGNIITTVATNEL